MWDNESIAQYIVNEQERLERLRDRFEREEVELPFVDVTNDYGQHEDELYGR